MSFNCKCLYVTFVVHAKSMNQNETVFQTRMAEWQGNAFFDSDSISGLVKTSVGLLRA